MSGRLLTRLWQRGDCFSSGNYVAAVLPFAESCPIKSANGTLQ